jgi:hypothetical protein
MSRVVIPRDVDKFINLLNLIIDKETGLAGDANFSPDELQMLTELCNSAKQANEAQATLYKQAEEQVKARDNALGIGSVNTPGTAMYFVTKLRDLLLAQHKTNAKTLGAWGFTVDDSKQTTKGDSSKK